MDYEFFQSLSVDEAEVYLSRYLDVERGSVDKMAPHAAQVGILMDYSMSSIASVLKWMADDVKIHRVPVPETEPEWIRQAHNDGLVEFDADSKAIIMRASYYLGETFVRVSPRLSWGIGRPDLMEKNMPVVLGFRYGLELPPIVVAENLFSRIAGHGAPVIDIDRAIESWREKLP